MTPAHHANLRKSKPVCFDMAELLSPDSRMRFGEKTAPPSAFSDLFLGFQYAKPSDLDWRSVREGGENRKIAAESLDLSPQGRNM